MTEEQEDANELNRETIFDPEQVDEKVEESLPDESRTAATVSLDIDANVDDFHLLVEPKTGMIWGLFRYEIEVGNPMGSTKTLSGEKWFHLGHIELKNLGAMIEAIRQMDLDEVDLDEVKERLQNDENND